MTRISQEQERYEDLFEPDYEPLNPSSRHEAARQSKAIRHEVRKNLNRAVALGAGAVALWASGDLIANQVDNYDRHVARQEAPLIHRMEHQTEQNMMSRIDMRHQSQRPGEVLPLTVTTTTPAQEAQAATNEVPEGLPTETVPMKNRQ